jgi:hypothetical protein
MAWPLDARLTDYAALVQVKSADLNAIQDAIINVHRARELAVINAIPGSLAAAAEHGGWHIDPANPEQGWVCDEAGVDLTFPLDLPSDALLLKVGVKYYNAQVGAVKPTGHVYHFNPEFSVSANAPTLIGDLGDFTAAADINATSWGFRVCTLGTPTSPSTAKICVAFINAGAGDKIAGLLIQFQPHTLTGAPTLVM